MTLTTYCECETIAFLFGIKHLKNYLDEFIPEYEYFDIDDITLFKKFPKKDQNTLVIWFNNLEGLSKGKITFSVSNYLQTATLFPSFVVAPHCFCVFSK